MRHLPGAIGSQTPWVSAIWFVGPEPSLIILLVAAFAAFFAPALSLLLSALPEIASVIAHELLRFIFLLSLSFSVSVVVVNTAFGIFFLDRENASTDLKHYHYLCV
jgi:hypothetical protein